RSSATYVRRTQYFICLLVVTLSRYSYPTRRSSDLAFRLTFHSAGNIAIRTNRQSPRRSRLPRNRRLTAERSNPLTPRQCEISGLARSSRLQERTSRKGALAQTPHQAPGEAARVAPRIDLSRRRLPLAAKLLGCALALSGRLHGMGMQVIPIEAQRFGACSRVHRRPLGDLEKKCSEERHVGFSIRRADHYQLAPHQLPARLPSQQRPSPRDRSRGRHP